MAHKHLIPLCRTHIFLHPDVWAAEPSISGSAGWVNSRLLGECESWGTDPLLGLPSHGAQRGTDGDARPSPRPCPLPRDASGTRACTVPGKILGVTAATPAPASLQRGEACLLGSASPGARSGVLPCRPPTRVGQSPRLAAEGRWCWGRCRCLRWLLLD